MENEGIKTSLNQYFSEVGNDYTPLTYEEEYELFRRYKEENDRKAYEKIVENNLKLVIHIANEYIPSVSTTDKADYIAAGNLGLLMAVNSFDYKQGVKFSSYAVPAIRSAIIAENRKGQAVHCPQYIITIGNKIERLKKEYLAKNNTLPTKDYLIKKLDITEPVYDAVANFQNYNFKSLEDVAMNGEDNKNLLYKDTIEGTSENDIFSAILQKELREEISKILDKVIDGETKERDKDIFCSRFGLFGYEFKTTTELGEKYGITRQRVDQIFQRILKKMKHPKYSSKLRGCMLEEPKRRR